MKLFTSTLSVAFASHYRGGTYQFAPNGSGSIDVTVTQTWRDSFSGYSPACTQDDVVNQIPSPNPLETALCFETATGASCGKDAMDYTVTFKGQDYCYGDGVHQLPTPSGPFTYGWSSCCWVSFTADNGGHAGGGHMQQIATVNDLTNNSPIFKHPPLWLIMAQCDGQYIDLAPKDPDEDVVRCRWATQAEAGGAYTDPNLWPSLTLDPVNCVVHYTGSLDTTNYGVKPVALTMEDFDSAGNVRSSIPVQFLAQVWTPNLRARTIAYPDWFPVADHHNDEQHSEQLIAENHQLVARGRRDTPAYCTAVPYFVGDTPADGDVLDASSGQLSFTLQAESQIGSISSFTYQGPLGLICTDADDNGSSSCTWTPAADQLAVENHQFCFDATDSVGLLTERRCIVIETSVAVPSPGNIFDCAIAILDGPNASPGFFRSADVTDYGCAGRGTFDAFATTEGKQLDQADHAFYAWKKCYQCATGGDSSLITDYVYDIANDSCADSTPESRPLCECDRKLISVLAQSVPNPNFVGFSADRCSAATAVTETDCCNYNTYMWESYNIDTSSCCAEGVKPIGTC